MGSAVDLAKQSDSTIILFIIVIVILIIAFIPVIKIMATINSSKHKQYYEHEGMLIQVIEKNTEVNSALKTLIEADRKHCESCKQEQFGLFRKVFDNQELANTKLAEISIKLEKK